MFQNVYLNASYRVINKPKVFFKIRPELDLENPARFTILKLGIAYFRNIRNSSSTIGRMGSITCNNLTAKRWLQRFFKIFNCFAIRKLFYKIFATPRLRNFVLNQSLFPVGYQRYPNNTVCCPFKH